jgi:hypothetical protein
VPVPSTVTEADWPLITYEETLALGEVEDHAEIEALIERACRARVERFADSTDMCSLVYAKSADAPRTRLLRPVALRRCRHPRCTRSPSLGPPPGFKC